MIGREKTKAELERDLVTTPFENYTLYRGRKSEVGHEDGNYRSVGMFKVTWLELLTIL